MVDGFEALVERHQQRVYTFARYTLGRAEAAEDVTQEVLMKLWNERHKLDPERVGAWLLRVTRNACVDRLRRRKSTARVLAEDPEGEAAATAWTNEPGPEAWAEASDVRRHLRAALEELGEPYRSVVILREVQGLRYREIAEVLEMPLNTVRVYLHRARRRLREQLRGVYEHAATA